MLARSHIDRLRVSVSAEKVVGIAVTGVVLYLVATPLCVLLFASFRSTGQKLPFEATSFTLENYVQVFTSDLTYRLLWNTLYYSAGSLAIGLVIAVALAWLLERSNVPHRSLLFVLVLSPMAIPGVVGAMAWVLLANPTNGVINVALRSLFGQTGDGPLNIYSLPGMIWVTALMLVPSIFLMISGTFSRLDPAMEEASKASGATPLGTFLRIVVPLLRPAILAAVIYYFVLMIEVFEIPGLLGMPRHVFMFSTAIFNAAHPTTGLPNYGLASGYGMVTFMIAAILVYVYGRLIRHREQFAVMTGRGYRPRLTDLGRWKYVALGGTLTYTAIAVVLPSLILIWTSLLPTYRSITPETLSTLTLAHYSKMVGSRAILDSVVNTAIVSLTAATITTTLASVVSFLSVRSTLNGGRLAERLTFVVLGVPGVVVALALIFVYVWIPLPIYATIWIIVIGLVTRFLTYSTRVMSAAYLQIHRELEEASRVSGAQWWRTMGWIVFPLVWPSLARCWLWTFVQSVRDATIALMLFAIGSETIAVRLWITWFEEANFPLASAIAVPLMLVSGGLTFLVAKHTTIQTGQGGGV